MSTSYFGPLERAWARTRRILFDSFDPETWLVIGFASFLAGLVGGWAGLGFSPGRGIRYTTSLDHFVLTPRDLLVHSTFNKLWFLGVPFMVLVAIVTLALLWISSRGKFVFLDNLLHARGAIVAPWRRYRRLGNSLFLWRLGLILALLIVLGVLLSPMVLVNQGTRHWEGFWFFGTVAAAGAAALGLVVGAVAAYVGLFLEGFVVPLMYRREITATEAWRAFLPLLQRHPADFLLFGVLIAAAWLLVAACVFIAGVATCCLLFLLLSIPYVNSLLLLPLSAVFRLYTLEFLGQFGEDYRIVPAAAETTAETPAAAIDEPPTPPVGPAD